jgi:restriction endonuclease S subunit
MISLQFKVTGIEPPSHWTPRKLKHVLRLKKFNKNDGLKEKNLLSLSYGNIIRKDIESAEGLVPASFEGYQIVEPGDIVLRLTDLQNDKRSLRQGLVGERGIVTSAYDAVYPSKSDDPEYWYYFLYALDISKYYYSLGGGVRQSISFNDFPNDWIISPDLSEQRKIVENLKKSLFAIDAIVSQIGGNRAVQVATEGSLLSLLAKRRQAAIVQAIMASGSAAHEEISDKLMQRLAAAAAAHRVDNEVAE